MAITRAQQARQMLKDGNFAVQGGVKNYLGEQETVSDVPIKWQSGPDKPSTELAYITKAEKDLLLKKDIHGSLKDGPNKGPGGLMSLDSFGDDPDDPGKGFSGADVSAAERGEKPAGMSQKQADEFRGGAIAAGAGTEGKDDTAGAKREAEKIKKESEKRRRDARRAITREEKIEAKKNRKKMRSLLKADKLARQQRIKDILSGKIANFGLTETQLADLKALGISPEELKEDAGLLGTPDYQGGRVDQDLIDQFMEKSDRFSGVDMETFKEKFNMPNFPGAAGIVAKLLEGPLKKGSRINKDFFVDRTLPYGAFNYEGLGVTPEMFGYLSPLEQQEIFGDYARRRGSGEIDAMGRPVPPDDRGPSQQEQDPCKGPNPPAYCFANKDPVTDPVDPRSNFYGLTPRIGGSIFDFSGFEDGGRVAAMDGGIMDVARQGLFLGGITKGIKKGLKSVTRGIKKVAKSPLGKIALAAAAGGYGFGLGPFAGMKGAGFLKSAGVKNFLFKDGVPGIKNLSNKGLLSIIGGASLLPLLMGQKEEEEFDIEDYYAKNRLNTNAQLYNRIIGSNFAFAEGGDVEPVAKKTMPLLDMGGQEMDLRAEGGFVPIGRMEKADDVPARLSKNEFVFTADAVRNAGDGDVDKGAEVMYNMMKNLESGGEVSEESQGLEGAREMFQTSKRLEEVL